MDELIGTRVKYYDYLDMERFGTIVDIEPYPNDSSIVYLYIRDVDDEYNIHNDVVNGKTINYAEIRPSNDVYLE